MTWLQVNLAEIHLLYIAYSGWIYTGRLTAPHSYNSH
jgi:hypothetical protein